MALNKDTGGIRPKLDEQSANCVPSAPTDARKDAAKRAYVEARNIPDQQESLKARFKALMDLIEASGGSA